MRPFTTLLVMLLTAMVALLLLGQWLRPLDNAVVNVRPVGYRVDLNHADAATLCLLPGVGPSLAQRILDDRNARGSFASPDDLERVPGIGERTTERLRPFVVCTPVTHDQRGK